MQDKLRPTRLGPDVLAACDGDYTMALTGGCVWTCGQNDFGQLGHGDRTDKHLFTRVDPGHFGGASIIRPPCHLVAAGYAHSVVELRRRATCSPGDVQITAV